MKFTTGDKDNDVDPVINCATQYKGGWWYKQCFECNLNGLHGDVNIDTNIPSTLQYMLWTKEYKLSKHTFVALKEVEMKIRPATF